MGEAVEPGEQRGGRFEQARRSCDGYLLWTSVVGGRSGTGSQPDGPNGRQRARRRSVEPQTTERAVDLERLEWRSDEHDGVNRHGEGRPSHGPLIADDQARSAARRPTSSSSQIELPVRRDDAVRRRVGRRSGTRPAASAVGRRAPQHGPQPPAQHGCARRLVRCARPRANATRGGVAMPEDRECTCTTALRPGLAGPRAAKRANALRSRMRQIKPTGGAGPWRGVTSARLARRGCSCGGGSRASWHGDGCSVGRCASRNPPRATPRWAALSMAT